MQQLNKYNKKKFDDYLKKKGWRLRYNTWRAPEDFCLCDCDKCVYALLKDHCLEGDCLK